MTTRQELDAQLAKLQAQLQDLAVQLRAAGSSSPEFDRLLSERTRLRAQEQEISNQVRRVDLSEAQSFVASTDPNTGLVIIRTAGGVTAGRGEGLEAAKTAAIRNGANAGALNNLADPQAKAAADQGPKTDSAGAVQTEAETARDDGAASQNPPPPQAVIDAEGRVGPEAATTADTNAVRVEPTTDVNTNSTNSGAVKTTAETQATPASTAAPGAANSGTTPSNFQSAVPAPSAGGVAVGSDDSIQTQATNATAAAVNSRFNLALQPQPNILDQYASYTYSISIYLLGPREIAEFQESKTRSLNSGNLLIQSGGIPRNDRNQFFPLDFYIDDLQVKTFQQGAGTGIAHNTTEMSFKLVEPLGITLFRRLTAAIKEYNERTNSKAVHYASQPYLMAIRFYGYDIDGNLVSPNSGNLFDDPTPASTNSAANAITEKFIPFIFSNIKLTVTNALTEYQCSCMALQDLGFSQTRGIVPYNVQLTATTLENLLSGNATFAAPPAAPPAANAAATAAPPNATAAPKPTVTGGLTDALNKYQQERVKSGEYEFADVYKIVFTDQTNVIRNAQIIPPGQTNLGTTGQTAPTTAADAKDPKKNSVNNNSLNVAITAGMPVSKFLDQVIRGSQYIYDQQVKIKDPKTGKIVPRDTGAITPSWYRIGVQMRPLRDKFDRKRGDYAYEITYSINMYKVAKIESPWFPKGQFRGTHKKYEYLFTGRNTSVIKFDQDFNYQYYLTVNAEQLPQNITSDYRELYRKSYSPNSGQSSQGAPADAREPGANAADYLYSPSDQGQVSIEILGDPAWIYQGEMWSGVGGESITRGEYVNFLPDGTINHESQEVLFELAWNQPGDYNLDTGLMNIRRFDNGV